MQFQEEMIFGVEISRGDKVFGDGGPVVSAPEEILDEDLVQGRERMGKSARGKDMINEAERENKGRYNARGGQKKYGESLNKHGREKVREPK